MSMKSMYFSRWLGSRSKSRRPRTALAYTSTLPPVVGVRLGNASASDLETWAVNVLDADTINEVFNPH